MVKKKYICRANNEKVQPQFSFKYFEAIKLSSCFLRWRNGLSCIREYLEKEKAGEMRRPERDVTLDIAVNVSPCLSVFPISIVTFCRVIPWALWIVKPHAIWSGSFLRDLLVICHMPQFAKKIYVIEEHYVIFYVKVCN